MTGDPFWARSWYRRSTLLHKHDHGKRMYAPTPRTCPGIERDDGMTTGEKIALLACLLGIVALAVL